MKKTKNKKKAAPIQMGEKPTPERRQQNGGVVQETLGREANDKATLKRHRARMECALDAYLLKGKITLAEHQAGMRFRQAYLRAVLKIRVEDNGAGSHGDPEMAFIAVPASEQTLCKAYEVLTSTQKKAVIQICGHDEWGGTTRLVETLHRALEQLATLWHLG